MALISQSAIPNSFELKDNFYFQKNMNIGVILPNATNLYLCDFNIKNVFSLFTEKSRLSYISRSTLGFEKTLDEAWRRISDPSQKVGNKQNDFIDDYIEMLWITDKYSVIYNDNEFIYMKFKDKDGVSNEYLLLHRFEKKLLQILETKGQFGHPIDDNCKKETRTTVRLALSAFNERNN